MKFIKYLLIDLVDILNCPGSTQIINYKLYYIILILLFHHINVIVAAIKEKKESYYYI